MFDDAPDNDAKVKDTQGQQFDPSFSESSAGPDFGGSVTLPRGDTALGFITFDVPATAKIAKVHHAEQRLRQQRRPVERALTST
ncbi:DUF4352 domain-containing protein [Streptomyces canus]|uniref:hypothetical protein n=1 Tax=Streptomyces canus TaxID=58343 RepID=UPI00225400F3|nr:hypothetical protein [Streptomyces canus]MCX4853656.1 DUF4352 domain-containing protein [Streptomyces canus]WSW31105.1 DUF4352 domain-containing protein [Streptomyces canus]